MTTDMSLMTDGARTATYPLISVIMPCYNAEAYLREAVDSVLGQTYPNVELIVVDDGSTDGSLDLLRAYGDRIRLLSQANQGPYPARNHGLAQVDVEYATHGNSCK